MINATFAIAIAAAVLAAQGTRPVSSGNDNSFRVIIEPTSRPTARQAQQWALPVIRERVSTMNQPEIQRGPCGMPIIAADASVDPKMIVPIPTSNRGEAKIETAEPPSCGPFAAVPASKLPGSGPRR